MDKREVFISYHTESAKDRAVGICKALENAGITCWYAPRDVSGLYAGAIERAIDECKIFLLLLNEGSNHSQHVLNEVDSAFDRMNREEKVELLPFLVGPCQLSSDMRYYIRRIHTMDGTNPPDELRTRELVDRICKMLGKNPEKLLQVQEEKGQKEYRITGQKRYPDTHFVGRKQELTQLHTHLSGPVNKVMMVGMGGIGKSEIAKMYLKEHAEDYDVILWVSFDGSLQKTIASDVLVPIQGMQYSDYPEDTQRDYFLRKLQLLKQIGDRRVLLVVDNFDVTEDPDLEAFCGGSYGVLFTTRYHQESSGLPEVEVSGMTEPEDLMQLFRAEYQRPLRGEDLETVCRILAHLEGHPLSIRLVASAMQKNRRLQPETMLQMLKSGTVHEEKQGMKGTGTIGQYLRQVFRVSSLSEEEQFVLKNLSLLPLQGVDVTTFYDWCELDDFDLIDGLIEKSWVIHDPVADSVHLHPLVADLMLEELKKDPDCCKALVKNLDKACYVQHKDTWEYKVKLNDFATTLYERLPRNHPQRVVAMGAKARLCMSMSDYAQGAQLCKQLIPLMDSREKKLEMHYQHAHFCVLGGFPQEGIEAAQAGIAEFAHIALEQFTRVEGNWYISLYDRIAEAYVYLGQYDLAIKNIRISLEKQGNRFYSKTYETSRGWKYHHLAKALMFAGEYDEAEQTIRQSLALYEKVDDQWSMNYAYEILGQILMRKGQFAEALRLNTLAAERMAPLFGNDHVDIAVNLEFQGNIYAAMGEEEKAAGYYRQAVDIYLKRNCRKRAENAIKRLK